MAFVLADRVKETTIVVGTGAATLLGAASGYQSFSAGIGASNTTYYTIADQSGSNWEVGYGTLDATGLVLTRTTVLASSNSGSAVSFSAGTKDVWCDYAAKKAAIQDSLGTTTVPQLATNSTTSTTPVLSFNASNSNYAAGASVSGSYLQTLLQNKSGTAGASTNYVLSNDLGTDSSYYGEFGMNSSVFSSGTPVDFYSINNGVYFSGHDGDVSVGSGNGYKTYLTYGTAGQSSHVINASGAIGLSTNLGTTPALSGTTGYGTSGYLMQSGGSAASPTWVAQSTIAAGSATTATNATNIGITDDTTTATSVYPTWVTTTTGNLPAKTASTKLSFVPSTGTLTATAFSGSGASLTGISGTISWQSVQTSNFTASSGNGYPVNTTSTAITVTFPASPSAGNIIILTDYAGTWNTKNVTINPNGNKIISETANLLLQNQRESVSFVYIDSTQGWLPYSGFQDAIPVSTTYTASYLAVAGGGGGVSGGGGAGGYRTSTASLNAGTTYTITVGGGGSAGSNGSDSVISGSGLSTITSVGGGAGTSAGNNGASGGSGGGGAASGSGTTTGGSGTSGQGNAGGGNVGFTSGPYPSGGGGGAGATGANAVNSTTSGAGGNGTASSITGSSVTYAGGGGGATYIVGNPSGAGGSGGGGAGNGVGTGTAGTANTGGGGGGSYSAGTGGAGGSGVVILSVPTSRYSGTTTGSPSVTTSGSNTILTYNSSGSYTG